MTAALTAPYPPIPTFVDGRLVRQADLNGLGLHANDLYTQNLGGFLTYPPLCTVRKTTTQSVPITTDTQVLWDVADINGSQMWSASNPGVMTVLVTGTYFVYAQLITSGAATQLGVRLLVNGLNAPQNSITTFSAQSVAAGASGIAALDAGSVISTSCYQSNGSPATLLTSLGSCRMAALLISN